MKDVCEQVCVSAMAMADGYRPDLPPDQIDAHLSGCEACRREVADLKAVASLFEGQERRVQPGNVWPSVARHLEEKPSNSEVLSSRRAFILLGLMLVGYKLVEMVPERNFGMYIKIVPVLLVIAIFGYLKENPFRINTELRLEGE